MAAVSHCCANQPAAVTALLPALHCPRIYTSIRIPLSILVFSPLQSFTFWIHDFNTAVSLSGCTSGKEKLLTKDAKHVVTEIYLMIGPCSDCAT